MSCIRYPVSLWNTAYKIARLLGSASKHYNTSVKLTTHTILGQTKNEWLCNSTPPSVVGWSVAKCCSVAMFFWFFILIVRFMYSYCQVCSVLYTLCQLAFSGYPHWGFSVLFPQLYGKCQGIPRKDGARPALFLISKLCCSRYCLCRLCCSMYCLCRLWCSLYCLCVNVCCTTATGCQPNCS
jgi:hypothetical protein